MKMNWYFLLGVSFIIGVELIEVASVGSYVPGDYVDWRYLIMILFLTGTPFVFGYLAGKKEVKP